MDANEGLELGLDFCAATEDFVGEEVPESSAQHRV